MQIARQLAKLPNGSAVLEAMATECTSRIRYRLSPTRQDAVGAGVDLEAQVLAHAVRFFERVGRRHAELLRAPPDGEPAD